jgi:beta-mannosidase
LTTRISLNGEWLFKDFVGQDWRWRNSHLPDSPDFRWWRVGHVPGSVGHDLWQLGEIPNPYVERNTLLIEWIPARTWLYKRTFQMPPDYAGQRIQLRFKGVDYEAEFWLNGESLGTHSGMFTPALFDVTGKVKFGEDNLLSVVIEPAPHEQAQVGRTSLVRTGKGRMGYGWDFCPRVVHQGIWDDVSLEITGPARIEDVFVRPTLAGDLDKADVTVAVEISTTRSLRGRLKVTLRDGCKLVGTRTLERDLPAGRTTTHLSINLARPRLWHPNEYPLDTPGNPPPPADEEEQPLYTAEVTVSEIKDGEVCESDSQLTTFGIRRIEMVANDTPDTSARPYTLVVNGQKVYTKGWNWVPMDVFFGVDRPQKLARLLTLARRAHVNLLRVWGGGLIAKEDFYEACDRYGIMVWQEFIQSSSGIDNIPPDDPAYIAMLVNDAEQIIRAKRNHPSLAIWCGGNELMSAPDVPADDRLPALSALHGTVQRLDPDRQWLPTSASGPHSGNCLEQIAADPQGMHDVHGPWEYQGLTEQYTLSNQGACLFHSEFGVEGYTNLKTLEATIGPEHRWPATRENLIYYHTASWWIKEKMLAATFGDLPDLPTTVRATQFMQADGLRYAVEADRRRKWHNSGTLPWQFDEPYPNTACTSAVDYYAQPKPVYYAVARAYEPLHLSARFDTLAWAGKDTFTAKVWANNSASTGIEGAVLTMRVLDAHGEACTTQTAQVTVGPNAAVRLAELSTPLPTVPDAMPNGFFLLDLALAAADGAPLAANRYVFSAADDLSPLLAAPATELEATLEAGRETWTMTLSNTGGETALWVWLEDDRPLDCRGYVYFDDNYFCLLPGESRTIQAEWSGVPAAERRLRAGGWNTNTVLLP